jgi:hypothetical protein
MSEKICKKKNIEYNSCAALEKLWVAEYGAPPLGARLIYRPRQDDLQWVSLKSAHVGKTMRRSNVFRKRDRKGVFWFVRKNIPSTFLLFLYNTAHCTFYD